MNAIFFIILFTVCNAQKKEESEPKHFKIPKNRRFQVLRGGGSVSLDASVSIQNTSPGTSQNIDFLEVGEPLLGTELRHKGLEPLKG